MSDPGIDRRRARTLELVALAGVAILATLRFLPALHDAHWLSDDYALLSLVQRDVDPPTADWGRIWGQFHERWLLSHAYWRPLVPISYGVNTAVLGFGAWSFTLGNLVMHVAAACATAHLCSRLSRGGALAALLGGAFFALHPLAVEPVLWISARVSTLQVALHLGALCALAAHLQDHRRRSFVVTVVLAAMALLSKESAIALPVDFLLVDLCDRFRRPLRTRLALHLRFVPLWVGYLGLRRVLLGSIAGLDGATPDLGHLASLAAQKLGILFVPDASRWVLAAWIAVAMLGTASAIGARAHGGARAALGDLAILALGLLGPLATSFANTLSPDLVGSRLVYGALPVLAIVALRLLSRHRRASLRIIAMGGGIAFLVVASWPVTDRQLQRYDAAREAMAAMTRDLAAPPRKVDADHPAALLSVPAWKGIPGVINAATAHALGEPPFGARRMPLLSIVALLQPQPYTQDTDPSTPDLYGDPSPIHALLDHGCPVAFWNDARQQLEWIARTDLPEELLAPAADGVVHLPQPIDALGFEAIELHTDAATTHGSLAWSTSQGLFSGPVELPFSGGEVHGDERVFVVDASRHAPLLVAQSNAIRIDGFAPRLDTGRVHGLRLQRVAARLHTDLRFEGAALRLGDLEQRMVFDVAADDVERDVVLLTGAAIHALRVTPSGRVVLTPIVREYLQAFAVQLRGDRVMWLLRAQNRSAGSPCLRSELDVFRLRAD